VCCLTSNLFLCFFFFSFNFFKFIKQTKTKNT
jgi:hypothetical protein